MEPMSLPKQKMLRKPLMLKDYLLDDLSSCSSSGFRTLPRKQQYCCTTTIRFLLEIDLKNNKPMKPTKYIKKQATLSSSATSLSAFQRAINAVKSFPFAGVNRSACSSNKLKLPRSLSRKLFKRSFWKRSATDYRKEIKRREPIKELSVQKESPVLDFAGSTPVTGDSHSSTSESNRKSYSWSDSDFTVSDYSSGNSSEVKISKNNNFNDVVSRKDKVVNSNKVGGIVGGDDSVDSTTSSNNIKWPSEEEKEQFSPVSVLDCPFDDDDDDDEVSSPFQHRLARLEGTKKRLMKKIKRFERLTLLEPVNLEKRITRSESDRESNESPLHGSSQSVHEDLDFTLDSEEEENNQASDKALELLQLVTATMPSNSSLKFKADYHEKLLLDFFKEGLMLEMDNINCSLGVTTLDHNKLINVAKDWIMGQPRELFLEWEVQTNRAAYIRDMERGGTWMKVNIEEKKAVVLEVEVEVFDSLMNDLLHDLLSS